MQDHEQKNTCASVPFRTIAHIYDPDNPSPEDSRGFRTGPKKRSSLRCWKDKKERIKRCVAILRFFSRHPTWHPTVWPRSPERSGPISSAGRMR